MRVARKHARNTHVGQRRDRDRERERERETQTDGQGNREREKETHTHTLTHTEMEHFADETVAQDRRVHTRSTNVHVRRLE